MAHCELAFIGGTGLYTMPGLTDIEAVTIDTPFGQTSDVITTGTLHGRRLAFVPRHGRGHSLTPSEVPYAANIYALKQLGARYVVAVSACGSLRERFEPGHFVVPDQLVDLTKGLRRHTFFGDGLVGHVGVADPFSPELVSALVAAAESSGGVVHRGGTYVTVEGPRFSTRAESELFRQWGMGIIGMTTSPEAFLAAEAELAYACLATVTDYDVWHDSEGPVTVDRVVEALSAFPTLVSATIDHLVRHMGQWEGEFAAHSALSGGLITASERIPADTRETLRPVLGRYLE